MTATVINVSDFVKATEMCLGWCTGCKEFTRETTEPDAEDYDCPVCRLNTVVGANNALVMGLIEFRDGEE